MRFIRYFIFVVSFIFYNSAFGSPTYFLVEPKLNSGNNQSGVVNEILQKPFVFKVLDANKKPVSHVKIFVSLVKVPKKSSNAHLSKSVLVTNSLGECEVFLQLGNIKGEYEVLATLSEGKTSQSLLYSSEAISKAWMFWFFVGLLGGLILFLYGMFIMGKGLEKSAGSRMRSILSKLTAHKLVGLSVGAVVTAILQSSSATSVMLVSFVHSKLMQYKQTLSILLGATIGSTITVQLISFKLTDYALVFIFIGGLLSMFTQKQYLRYLGETILGFGILFFGLFVMSESIIPIKTSQVVLDLFASLQNPFIAILAGALFTAVIQSSAASIGIIIVLASQGLLTLNASIAFVLGANLGTPVTALLASINTSYASKRVGYTLLFYKFLLVLIFGSCFSFVEQAVYAIEGVTVIDTENMGRIVANLHTFFNVVIALLLLPFTSVIARFLTFLIPDNIEKNIPISQCKYIDYSFVNQPAIAIQLAKEETLRFSRKISFNMQIVVLPFIEREEKYLKTIEENRIQIKALRDSIRAYLLQVNASDKTNAVSDDMFTISHVLTELSHINDIISTYLHTSAVKWLDSDLVFDDSEMKDVIEYHNHLMLLYHDVMRIFNDETVKDALKIKKKIKEFSSEAIELEKHYYERILVVENNDCVSKTKTYLELINMMQMIAQHIKNIARQVK